MKWKEKLYVSSNRWSNFPSKQLPVLFPCARWQSRTLPLFVHWQNAKRLTAQTDRDIGKGNHDASPWWLEADTHGKVVLWRITHASLIDSNYFGSVCALVVGLRCMLVAQLYIPAASSTRETHTGKGAYLIEWYWVFDCVTVPILLAWS